MKYLQPTLPLIVFLGYVAITLLAATSIAADAAKLKMLPTANSIAASQALALPEGVEIYDLGSMTVTATRQ